MTSPRGHSTDEGRSGSVSAIGDAIDVAQKRLLAHIDRVVTANGVGGGLRPALRAALLDCPRHLFVGRYQLAADGPILDTSTGRLEDHCGLIYRDVALGHVDAAGRPFASTNSPPSTSLCLLERLDLRPGQTVLEIGSGSGWTLALMARAVGESGHAIGIEIVPELAEGSRRALSRAGISNASVVTGDGALGFPAGVPFDRVIFTTGIWSLPTAFFGQISKPGRLIAPFQIKGPGVDVLAFDNDGGEFHSVWSMPSFFVRAAGKLEREAQDLPPLSKLRLRSTLGTGVPVRIPMPFGAVSSTTARGALFGALTTAFRSYLTKTEPDMRVFAAEQDDLLPPLGILGDPGRTMEIGGFGFFDEARGSLAVCTPGELIAYGDPAACNRMLSAYQSWTDLMMPGVDAFDAVLRPRDGSVPPADAWTEIRGDTALVWSLKKGWPRLSRLRAQ